MNNHQVPASLAAWLMIATRAHERLKERFIDMQEAMVDGKQYDLGLAMFRARKEARTIIEATKMMRHWMDNEQREPAPPPLPPKQKPKLSVIKPDGAA
jgi:hypothetical protein